MTTGNQHSIMFRVIDIHAARKVWQRRSHGNLRWHAAQPRLYHQVYLDTAEHHLRRATAWLTLCYEHHQLHQVVYHDATTHQSVATPQHRIPQADIKHWLQPYQIAMHTLLPMQHVFLRHHIRQAWQDDTHIADVSLITQSHPDHPHAEVHRLQITPHGAADDAAIQSLITYYQEHIPLVYPRSEDDAFVFNDAHDQHDDMPVPSDYQTLQRHVLMLLGSSYTADEALFLPIQTHDSPARRLMAATAVALAHDAQPDTEPLWLACDSKQRTTVQQLVQDCQRVEHPLTLLPLEISELPFAEVLRMLLRVQFRKIMHRRQEVHRTNAASDIHRLRVTLRKTLALLDCAESMYDAELMHQYRRGLRRMARFLGVIRDCDTLNDNVTRILGVHHIPTSIARAIAHKRAHALGQLNELLSHSKQQKFLAEFARFVAHTGHACVTQPSPLVVVLQERLRYRLDLLQQPFSTTFARVPEDEIHEFRIRCRDLRYLIEAFPDEILTPNLEIITILTNVQDRLGSMQDAVVTQQLLTEMKLGTDNHAKRILSTLRNEATHIRSDLPQLWEQVTNAHFRTTVEAMLAPQPSLAPPNQ